ncbi:hypothetical protein FDP25_14620 [Roseovarius sp. A21]|uniref:Uncharacterized protein n=1 Tax=Roseovarius bejariae TaxID=2576383 RepID=A0A844CPY5_9RHOB|nr:hypothetical protein [Roseovarius bejariae]MRU16672.1 hypothetical protein [Roseovarius bejariae]
MENKLSLQAIRKGELARLRQEAYARRAGIAKRWGRRCLFLTAVALLVVAWQDPTLGPVMQTAAADAVHSVDVLFGGDGNARELVVAAMSDIRG